MPTIEIELPSPHGGQTKVVSEAKRFNVLACGRRWGKTLMCEELVLDPALDGAPTAWIAPNYKYLLEPWEHLKRITKPIQKKVSEQDKRIFLVTGGNIDFWTSENGDPCRSYRYKRVVLDETALTRNLERVWNDAVRPALADFRGDAWMPSTPRGQDAYWRFYCQGQDPLNAEWASWQMPTSTNPHIAAEEIEAARLGMPERSFRQEFLAEFMEDSGGVFRGVHLAVEKGRTEIEPPKPGSQYQLGVDLARVEDFTVLSVVDSSGRQVYFDRFNQISWERQAAEIETVAKRYNATVLLDSTGIGDPVYEMVRKRGVRVTPYHLTNTSKEALIDNAAMSIEKGAVSLMDVQVQTDELTAYQYSMTPSRNVTMGAPEGMHDDTVIALALSLWGNKPAATVIRPVKRRYV